MDVADNRNAPDPDHAWKTLTLVNDWIKHADAKTAATLAGTAATAVALFNVLNMQANRGCALTVTSVACACLLLWSAWCSLQALVPRRVIKRGGQQTYDNLLFYAHVALSYGPLRKSEYTHALGKLTMDHQELTRRIAEQVHSNSHVADQKYDSLNKAINALALAVVFLAAAALAAIWK